MKSISNIKGLLIILFLTAIVILIFYAVLSRQYSKGVEDGKNDPAIKVERINNKNIEVRETIKKVVNDIGETFKDRDDRINQAEEDLIIANPTDIVIMTRLDDPDQGISDEMFVAINKARSEANND